MKFKQLSTGVMLETNNEFVIEQLRKSANYEEVKVVKEEKTTEKEVEKKK